MDDFDELPLDPQNQTRPIDGSERAFPEPEPERRHDAGAPGIPVAIAVAVAVIVGLALFAWLRSRSQEVVTTLAPVAGAPAAAETSSQPVAAAPARPLPPLDSSDAFVREAAALLSSRAELARWLADDGLVRRFVAVVANVAEGASPATHLPFLRPAGAFQASSARGVAMVEPASYRRYDLATAVFTSLDTEGCVRLRRELAPLLDAAWSEIGEPGRSFDDVLGAAIDRLVSVPVPASPAVVVADGALWQYADPDLAGRSAAEKHLLRMGPENARAVQAKLRELAAALGLSLTSSAT